MITFLTIMASRSGTSGAGVQTLISNRCPLRVTFWQCGGVTENVCDKQYCLWHVTQKTYIDSLVTAAQTRLASIASGSAVD